MDCDYPDRLATLAKVHRRAFLARGATGVGSLALASLLEPSLLKERRDESEIGSLDRGNSPPPLRS